jgi:ribose/xylose/arabinose/galactoside ABC-type transport system permease subunit
MKRGNEDHEAPVLRLLQRLGRIGQPGGVALPLVALWIICALWVPRFLTQVNITNLVFASAIIGILALGSTVVILTEEIDLSIGAVEGLGSVVAAIVIVHHGVPWPLGVVIATGAGLAVGLANGLITTIFRVPSFIVTLGTMGIVSGLALEVTNGQSIYDFPSDYQFLGVGEILGIRTPVYIAAGLLVILAVVLKFTPLGWHIYATGGSRAAASLVGIRTDRMRILAFAISGAFAGFAGVLVSARLNSGSAIFGQNDLLDAIAAVVIGGTALTGGAGTVFGTALGVLLISTVRNSLNLLNVSPFWQTVAIGAIIVGSAILAQLQARQSPLWRRLAR